jgi:drug/metabolite transporter (DMT)-like permease
MSLANWLAVLGVGLFSFVAQSLYTRGFQIEKVGVASIMTYLDVVFVFIWDSTLLREHINPWSFLGAAIVCSCSIMIVLRRAHHK